MTCPRPHSQDRAELHFARVLSAFGVPHLLPALSCFLLLPHLRDVSVLCVIEKVPAGDPRTTALCRLCDSRREMHPFLICAENSSVGAREAERKETVGVPG